MNAWELHPTTEVCLPVVPYVSLGLREFGGLTNTSAEVFNVEPVSESFVEPAALVPDPGELLTWPQRLDYWAQVFMTGGALLAAVVLIAGGFLCAVVRILGGAK